MERWALSGWKRALGLRDSSSSVSTATYEVHLVDVAAVIGCCGVATSGHDYTEAIQETSFRLIAFDRAFCSFQW